MTIDQISVFVENKPGKLAEITGLIGDAGIDLRAMSIADTTDFGILRLIVDKPQLAYDILKKADCVVSVTQVIAVSIEDKPGCLAKVLKLLSDEGINIEYVYAFITRKKEDAYVIFRMEDNERAVKILTENGIKLASGEEIYDL
jgi:hypothetical protein